MAKQLNDFLTKYGTPPENAQFAPGQRFACLGCFDTGWVTIYHPWAVQAAVRDPNTKSWRKTCVARCTECDTGNWQAHEFGGRGLRAGQPTPKFGDQPWHIRVADEDSWIQAAAYAELENHPNYQDAFAEYAG